MTSLHQQSSLRSSRFKGITSILNGAGTIQRGDQSSSGPFASFTMRGPVLIHQDFSSPLQGVHIQGASSIDDADSGAKPSAAHAPKRVPEGRVA